MYDVAPFFGSLCRSSSSVLLSCDIRALEITVPQHCMLQVRSLEWTCNCKANCELRTDGVSSSDNGGYPS